MSDRGKEQTTSEIMLKIIRRLFKKKKCCGNKSCSAYWGCVNDVDIATRRCRFRR